MKRLQWAEQVLDEFESGFQDVIWTDECTIQLQTHRHFVPQICESPKPNSWSVSVIHTLVLITLHYIISSLFSVIF